MVVNYLIQLQLLHKAFLAVVAVVMLLMQAVQELQDKVMQAEQVILAVSHTQVEVEVVQVLLVVVM